MPPKGKRTLGHVRRLQPDGQSSCVDEFKNLRVLLGSCCLFSFYKTVKEQVEQMKDSQTLCVNMIIFQVSCSSIRKISFLQPEPPTSFLTLLYWWFSHRPRQSPGRWRNVFILLSGWFTALRPTFTDRRSNNFIDPRVNKITVHMVFKWHQW